MNVLFDMQPLGAKAKQNISQIHERKSSTETMSGPNNIAPLGDSKRITATFSPSSGSHDQVHDKSKKESKSLTAKHKTGMKHLN